MLKLVVSIAPCIWVLLALSFVTAHPFEPERYQFQFDSLTRLHSTTDSAQVTTAPEFASIPSSALELKREVTDDGPTLGYISANILLPVTCDPGDRVSETYIASQVFRGCCSGLGCNVPLPTTCIAFEQAQSCTTSCSHLAAITCSISASTECVENRYIYAQYPGTLVTEFRCGPVATTNYVYTTISSTYANATTSLTPSESSFSASESESLTASASESESESPTASSSEAPRTSSSIAEPGTTTITSKPPTQTGASPTQTATQTPAPPGKGGFPTGITSIAGGVVGGCAILGIVIWWLWAHKRRQKRSAAKSEAPASALAANSSGGSSTNNAAVGAGTAVKEKPPQMKRAHVKPSGSP